MAIIPENKFTVGCVEKGRNIFTKVAPWIQFLLKVSVILKNEFLTLLLEHFIFYVVSIVVGFIVGYFIVVSFELLGIPRLSGPDKPSPQLELALTLFSMAEFIATLYYLRNRYYWFKDKYAAIGDFTLNYHIKSWMDLVFGKYKRSKAMKLFQEMSEWRQMALRGYQRLYDSHTENIDAAASGEALSERCWYKHSYENIEPASYKDDYNKIHRCSLLAHELFFLQGIKFGIQICDELLLNMTPREIAILSAYSTYRKGATLEETCAQYWPLHDFPDEVLDFYSIEFRSDPFRALQTKNFDHVNVRQLIDIHDDFFETLD
jgi:hypothetical protein